MPVSRRGWSFSAFLSRLCHIFVTSWLLIFLWSSSSVYADPTDLDQGFGNLGLTVTNVINADLIPKSLVPMPDGRYAIVGTIRDRFESSDRDGIAVAIYDADGVLEGKHGVVGTNGVMVERPSAWFSDLPNTQIDNLPLNSVSAAYHERDGLPGIVVGFRVEVTDTDTFFGAEYNFLVRFQLADDDQIVRLGFLDPGFGASGFVRTVGQTVLTGSTTRFLQGVAVDGVQRILTLTDYTESGQARVEIERRLPDGALDGAWGDAGAQVLDLPIRAPGRKLMIGSGDSVHVVASRVVPPYTDLAFARLDSNGALDTGYGAEDGLTFVRTSSTFTTDLIKAAFDPVGRLLFTGIGSGSVFMARLLANGQFDTGFSGNIDGTADGFYSSISTPPFGCAFAAQPDGRIVTTYDGGGVWIYRFLADALGEDNTFIDFLGSNIVDPFDELNIPNRTFRCFDMHLQSDGKIVVAGMQGYNTFDPGEIENPLTGFALIRLEGGDLDPPAVTATIRFEQTSFLVLENALFLSLRVLRNGAIDEEVSVAYQTIDDTANAGSDFTAVSGALTFDPGVTAQEIIVPILNDQGEFPEPDEQFSVVLSAPSVNSAIADGEGEAIITIRDAAAPLILLDSIFPPDDRSIDFGIVAVNGRATANLEIRNATPQSAPRTLAVSANLTGGSNAAFRIESSSCSTLLPTSAGICSLLISVEPLAAGSLGGAIEIHFEDVADPDYNGTAIVQLQALASNDADLEISVTLLNPPRQKIADDLARFRIAVLNRGPVPVNNPRVTITFSPELYAGNGPLPQFGTVIVEQLSDGIYAWNPGPLAINESASIDIATRLRLTGEDIRALAFVRANVALIPEQEPGVSDPRSDNNVSEATALIGGSDFRVSQTVRTVTNRQYEVNLQIENLGADEAITPTAGIVITILGEFDFLVQGSTDWSVSVPGRHVEVSPGVYRILFVAPKRPGDIATRNGAIAIRYQGLPLTGNQTAELPYRIELFGVPQEFSPLLLDDSEYDFIFFPEDMNLGNNSFTSSIIIGSDAFGRTGSLNPWVLVSLLFAWALIRSRRREYQGAGRVRVQ